MIYAIMLAIGMLLLLEALATRKRKELIGFLKHASNSGLEKDTAYAAVNIKMLTDEPFKVRLRVGLDNIRSRLGSFAIFKLAVFVALNAVAAVAIDHYLYSAPWLVLFPVVLLASSLVLIKMLQVYDRKVFDASFPNALNLLNGAVSSGESLMHAIIYVGKSLDGAVGKEFKLMGQRLRLGQPADEVLARSCRRFPYAPFYFFTITLRANINRGGQLKDIIKRLNQVMFNSQAIEKKKGAMTAEARMSVKIVASIPIFFMFFMYYMSPENFHFVLHHVDGRNILYYTVISEVFGILIIWFLMKRTQA